METINNYSFDEKKHLHTLDGKPLTGVTTVLSVISKPALIQWAANEAVKYIANKLLENDTKIIEVEWLEEAKTAHRKKKEAAGEAGTDVHALIELYVNGCINSHKGIAYKPEIALNPQVENFVNWAVENKVKFLESEKHVYSRSAWIGGICDLVMEIDGKVWIGDVKTASGIYPENFWQMAAYQMCLQEMGLYPAVEGHIVLNCKKDGTFETQNGYGYEENREAFMACLKIYRIKEKLNNVIK